MPTMYETVCKAFAGYRDRERALEENCQQLAMAFQRGLIALGWPEAGLRWIPWLDPVEDGKRYSLRDVMVTLHDEACEGVRLLAAMAPVVTTSPSAVQDPAPLLDWFYIRPQLRLRYQPGALELDLAGKPFTGGESEHDRIGKDAAAHFLATVCAEVDEQPAAWLKSARPKGTRKALGFDLNT
jgi:hypothetical protein